MEQMNIGGMDYPVIGFVKDKKYGRQPLVDIPMMSDYKWHVICLKSRMENPELYRKSGEDVDTVIAQLRATIAEYEKGCVRAND